MEVRSRDVLCHVTANFKGRIPACVRDTAGTSEPVAVLSAGF